MSLSRRAFLTRSAVLGCSAAASPLFTPVSLAAAPWDTRLVVLVLRGGMDALDVVQPHGAAEFAALRGQLDSTRAAHDLDGFFALHPALSDLVPLWKDGQLGFVHAVSTPYRGKRSHFDGQDILEAGTPGLDTSQRSGWLNRMLTHMNGVEARTAFAIGHGEMRILDGSAPVADWSPDADLAVSPQALRLAELIMQDDPVFHAALSEARLLSGADVPGILSEAAEDDANAMATSGSRRARSHLKVASFAAEQLRGDTRVASFSINGWDSHAQQDRTLRPALQRLSQTILALKSGLGPSIWNKTAIVAMTEFGRTARLNGTGGTDHGTGGAMLLAGGAIRGGRVYGRWPGVSEADLFERRDLMPTGDVRAPTAWLLRGLAGLSQSAIEQDVFPGLQMGDDAGYLL